MSGTLTRTRLAIARSAKYSAQSTQDEVRREECFQDAEVNPEPAPGILNAGETSCLSPVRFELRRLGKKITPVHPETFASSDDPRVTQRDAELEALGSKYSVFGTGCDVPPTKDADDWRWHLAIVQTRNVSVRS